MTFVSVLSSLLYLMVSALCWYRLHSKTPRTRSQRDHTPLVSDARWARAYALFAAFLGIWMLVWPYTGVFLRA
jgi:ABC-type Fe3+ transport system permease subunit